MKMAGSPFHLVHVVLLLFSIGSLPQVFGRPAQTKADSQILQELFGKEISSVLLAHPEAAEGSAQSPTPSVPKGRGLVQHDSRVEPPRVVVPRLFLDILSGQRSLRWRTRKGSARGCFGMKVDRIGVLSGLGC